MNLTTIYCLFIASLVSSADAGVSPEQRFDQAQAIFDAARQSLDKADGGSTDARRQFYESATRFADLARDGVRSVNLFVNTGNAYCFAGDNPRALLWYLRASRLANTPETRNGLITLRKACGAQVWPSEKGSVKRVVMFWHYDLSRRTKQWILLTTYSLGSLMMISARFIRRRRACLRLGLAFIMVGAAVGFSDIVSAIRPGPRWAVVLEDTKGHAGDGHEYSVLVEHLTPGQEVKITQSRGSWMQIELPTGILCWVTTRTCEPV